MSREAVIKVHPLDEVNPLLFDDENDLSQMSDKAILDFFKAAQKAGLNVTFLRYTAEIFIIRFRLPPVANAERKDQTISIFPHQGQKASIAFGNHPRFPENDGMRRDIVSEASYLNTEIALSKALGLIMHCANLSGHELTIFAGRALHDQAKIQPDRSLCRFIS